MDGETPGNPQNPTASRGQVVMIERQAAGELAGISRIAYDGTPLPLAEKNLAKAAVTTRDIDRGDFRHFLAKEIGEAPNSLQKTLRGRIVLQQGKLRVALPPASLPTAVAQALRNGRTKRILVIGQGTAAVAGQAIAGALADALARTTVSIQAMPATELSGFGMRDDMSDTLIVAVSQSGTTTDTNRTVDLVRGRGAPVLAIVNRRGSDLTDKADGVIYTSDGRDVEMSVASTKAFYAQCAAGQLLALALARAAKRRRRLRTSTNCCRRCSTCRRRCVRCCSRTARSPRSRASWRRSAATGRWSATARTVSPPPRSGSSSASCATSRSPATRPRTRSTSTCRRNR